MADLTDAQRAILSAAAKRADGVLLPAPKAFADNPKTATRALNGLVKRGLAIEQAVRATGAVVWRTDKEGKRFTLVLTEAGRQAIPADDQKPAPAAKKANVMPGKRGPLTSGTKSGTKLALLIDLLRRKGGVTIADAAKATGWQAHSVRGAISGTLKKKRGLAVASEAAEGGERVYRIAR